MGRRRRSGRKRLKSFSQGRRSKGRRVKNYNNSRGGIRF